MTDFIEARDVAHLFGGAASSTPYTPSAADGIEPAAGRTPLKNPESLETIFARLWERFGNGMAPVREYCFNENRGWRFDFAFPLNGLVAVECDGVIKKAGGGRHNTDGDRDKLNNAAAVGWRVLRFSRMQLEDQPEYTAELVKRALEF